MNMLNIIFISVYSYYTYSITCASFYIRCFYNGCIGQNHSVQSCLLEPSLTVIIEDVFSAISACIICRVSL